MQKKEYKTRKTRITDLDLQTIPLTIGYRNDDVQR